MTSHLTEPESNAATELPELGDALRRRRLERGLEVADAAAELGIPAKSLRVIEWDRHDLLASPHEADRIGREYAAFLGLEVGAPVAVAEAEAAIEPEAEAEVESEPQVAPAPPSPRDVSLAEWLPLLAALGPPVVIAVALVLDEVPLHLLGLVFLASLLLVAAALPSSVVARTPLAAVGFDRYRQPLGLAAIGILVPVAIYTLLTALT